MQYTNRLLYSVRFIRYLYVVGTLIFSFERLHATLWSSVELHRYRNSMATCSNSQTEPQSFRKRLSDEVKNLGKIWIQLFMEQTLYEVELKDQLDFEWWFIQSVWGAVISQKGGVILRQQHYRTWTFARPAGLLAFDQNAVNILWQSYFRNWLSIVIKQVLSATRCIRLGKGCLIFSFSFLGVVAKVKVKFYYTSGMADRIHRRCGVSTPL